MNKRDLQSVQQRLATPIGTNRLEELPFPAPLTSLASFSCSRFTAQIFHDVGAISHLTPPRVRLMRSWQKVALPNLGLHPRSTIIESNEKH